MLVAPIHACTRTLTRACTPAHSHTLAGLCIWGLCAEKPTHPPGAAQGGGDGLGVLQVEAHHLQPPQLLLAQKLIVQRGAHKVLRAVKSLVIS